MDEKTNSLTLHEAAKLAFELMYSSKRKGLLETYEMVCTKYNVNYSFEEVKAYLFHYDFTEDLLNKK